MKKCVVLVFQSIFLQETVTECVLFWFLSISAAV